MNCRGIVLKLIFFLGGHYDMFCKKKKYIIKDGCIDDPVIVKKVVPENLWMERFKEAGIYEQYRNEGISTSSLCNNDVKTSLIRNNIIKPLIVGEKLDLKVIEFYSHRLLSAVESNVFIFPPNLIN